MVAKFFNHNLARYTCEACSMGFHQECSSPGDCGCTLISPLHLFAKIARGNKL